MATLRAAKRRRVFALSLPGAWEDHPWQENVAKVGQKVFVFFGRDDTPGYLMGVKLARSWAYAKGRPFAEEMGYGLGKSG